MKEIKIKIPDNCEIFQDGNTYVIKEKEQKRPSRSWEEFCRTHPLTDKEVFIDSYSDIKPPYEFGERKALSGKNWCTSEEEAKAFLALMQLRQLRKAWVGDFDNCVCAKITRDVSSNSVIVLFSYNNSGALTFPTEEIARDFLECFEDLCETARILL